MSGYSRQSAADIVPTAVVRSAPVNAEFNAIRDAFAFSSGHKHDGSSTEGAYIPLIADTDGNNKVSVNTTNNRIGVFTEVSGASVEQVRFQDGAIVPVLTNDIDIGTSTAEFKNLYLDGTAKVDTLIVDENATVTGTVTTTGGFIGALTGNVAGNVTGNLTGNVTSTGTSTFTTVDINGGNIDGTTIGASVPVGGTFTTLFATSATLTNADINAGTIDNTTVGATTASTVRGTNITATVGFVGNLTGNVTGNLTGNVTGNVVGNVTGNLTGNVTAATGLSSFNDVTINGILNMDAGTTATITNLSTPVNSADAATKSYVDTSISNLVASAPGTLDTLNELAAALGDDPNFATTITTSIATKLSLAGGTMTGAIAMGANKITNLADPVSAQDAATKTYVDTADALKLNLTGGTLSGNLVMGANKVTTTADPVADDDLARKGYVDTILGSATAAAVSAANAATSESNAASSASAAATSETNAATSATNAAASATSASNDKLAAQAAATSATNTAAALTGFDLEAIAASKAVTAVDVFIYDTSKDSDGGAWRKRTQHTSWYNETLNTATRGSRREFPAVAVIVAESSKVTIYDGDDPALPMWMVFNGSATGGEIIVQTSGNPILAVSAVNGTLSVGTSLNGAHVISFISDLSKRAHNTLANTFVSGIASRNGGGAYSTGGGYEIINVTVNDVAMTVLPDAPIDPATGLPVPTIAVATDGGCSIIQNTGTVVDSGSTAAVIRVEFSGSSLVWVPGSTPQGWWITDNVGELSDGFSFTEILQREDTSTGNYPQTIQASTANLEYAILGDNLFSMANYVSSAPRSSGFYLYKRGEAVAANKNKGMIAKIQSGFNTGWMNGDIKGAFLSSTDTTSLVGSGELVTNGTFDTDTSGWTAVNSTLSIAANKLQVVSSGAGIAYAEQTLSGLTVGQTYILEATGFIISGSSKAYATIYTGTGTFVANAISNVSAETTGTLTFVASQTSMKVRLQLVTPTGSGDTGLFDNISVKLADADRSVNNKGLIVNGTVTRSPVATGAELVAYSGFSSSNYLEQPYNSALDFGTGDFCVMGWLKVNSTGTGYIIDTRNNSGDGIVLTSSTTYSLGLNSGSSASGGTVTTGVWAHVVGLRSSGVLYVYVNGVLEGSQANTGATHNGSSTLAVGVRGGLLTGALDGSLALWRISATAPTAEQIKKIYEDEKVLFQENAAATLYGTSDAVTALAHDSDTGLLHVGTSAGRSVFQGLRRVSNTTTAVGTAISASNGLVVEE